MIIPIRCMNCGKPISQLYSAWLKMKKEAKGENAEMMYYMDATTVPNTPEKKILDYLGLHRSCCRKHFLTQIDLMDKI